MGARAEDVALVSTVSAGAGIVAASLPAGPGDNVVLYERDFMSVVLPWRGLQARGVELRLLPLERLAEGIDERTALVAVSSVQSADGAVADLAALKGTGARLFVDATQAVGAVPTDLDGVDYLVTHAYKWLLSPRGLSFLYVHPERRSEIEPWTAGWKSCPNPYEDYYGFPELTDDARRLDVSVPWFAAAGARRSLELLLSLGPQRIADHNLALASRFTQELGRPEPAAPIVRVEVADADAAVERLQASGVACSMREGAVRLSFHLYNDEADVELAAAALRPAGIPSTAP